MDLRFPGDQILDLCSKAKLDVILTSPFIKLSALDRIVSVIPDCVRITCVTRWRLEELAAGVSDLEVWPFLKKRNAILLLRQDLHAKYYRADELCLIGSANITMKALGWNTKPNLELLIPAEIGLFGLADFERELFAGCIPVHDSLFTQMTNALQEFIGLRQLFVIEETEGGDQTEKLLNQDEFVDVPKGWLPKLRNPENLYLAYSGRIEHITEISKENALADLAALQVTPGLSKDAFKLCIAMQLLQKPIIVEVDKFVEIPQRFGAVRDLLSSLPCALSKEFNANVAWQTLMRWLLYFLPNRYTLSVPNHSEIFGRKN